MKSPTLNFLFALLRIKIGYSNTDNGAKDYSVFIEIKKSV